jgi:hypothetical protein
MRNLENGLPLNYAVRAVNGVENSLRAAACSEVHRQPFHPKMKRVEAQKLIEAAQMRHTETGSFVLKVACPIDAIPSDDANLSGQQSLFKPSPPFVRRAILGMNEAVRSLVYGLETDSLEKLVEDSKKDGSSPLSANLCDGLAAFQDDDSRVNLDISITWSARLETPPEKFREKIKIQWDYFPRIKEVGSALRPTQTVKEQPFVGLIDELKGDLTENDLREGEVIISLLVEGESIKAKANLNAEQHKIAYKAYGEGKTYVKITGLLNPGNQPRKLTNITAFSLVG